jgi:hypothetical protein
MTNSCNECKDVIHDNMQLSMKIDIWALLVYQFILLLVVCNYFKVDTSMLKQLLMTGIVICIVGFVASRLSKCNIDTGSWYMIMERFMIALLISVFLCKTDIPLYLKVISIMITCFIGFYDITSRRHYTSDLILTLTITYLAIGLFNSTKLNICTSVVSGVLFYSILIFALFFFLIDIYCHGNNPVHKYVDNIRDVVIEVFSVLSVVGCILLTKYYFDNRKAMNLSKMSFFSIIFLFAVCALIIVSFYFSYINNSNVALFAVIVLIMLSLVINYQTGLKIFQHNK